jgi:prepilin-type N-terminal cleavage/methylation domain-containing protein/prepilin-type processing-associated H-X9-DG protein
MKIVEKENSKYREKAKSAFTLIELLVVIAIISILAAILFPVFNSAREKARDVVCISNVRQLGQSFRMYLQDYDETCPIFQAYNTIDYYGLQAPPFAPNHLGVEMELLPYLKSHEVFRCPDDTGSPLLSSTTTAIDKDSHYNGFGSSYRFDLASLSVVAGQYGSLEGNYPFATTTVIVHDKDFQVPSNTRIMRDDEFPWFSPEQDPGGARYGYTPPGSQFGYLFKLWHPLGGSVMFADGHAKFIVNQSEFDNTACSPSGGTRAQGYWQGCD